MNRSGWLLACSIVLLGLAGCAKREATDAAHGQVLRVSQRNEPADLDPATATLPDEFFVIRALSEGLLIPDPAGGAPLPAAADRFDVSLDGLTYTFHLRADAKWSNGEPVTAADFVESYRRLLTPATAATKADLFFAVKNARAFATGTLADFSTVGFREADAHSFVVTLAQPTPRFPYYVASGPWIPVNPRAVAQHGRSWTQPGRFVGNGPFNLTEWRQHQRIVAKKNPAYHGAAGVRLEEIQFLRFDSGDTEERAFRAGQIDVTMDVPKTKIDSYARDNPTEFHRAPVAETRFLSFNTRRPALGDPRVRRALALAVDRRQIVEHVLLGGQSPATDFLPPQLAGRGLSPTPVSGVKPDLQTTATAEAQRLLAAAGFPGGKGFPRFEVSAWSSSQSPVLETLQAMWRQELGIDVSISIRDAKVHLAALAAGDYDIAFATTLPLLEVADPLLLMENFVSGAAGNYPHWSDARFDAMVARADFAAAETRLLELAAVAPLYFNTRTWLMSPRVRGWQEDALWSRSYLHVYLDEK